MRSAHAREPRARSLPILFVAGILLGSPAATAQEHQPHAHEHEHEEHEATEEIVITASPLPHTPDELAVPVDLLPREEILRELGSTLGDTLARRPGVATSSFAPGASRPVIRGQDAFRTAVLEGGLSTQDVSQLSPDHGIPVNPLTAQRIEIVRGPATLRYGGGASAGVVNALTNRVPLRREERVVTGEIFGAYGENADGRDLAAVLEGGHGPFAWHFDALSRDSDDYEIPGDAKQSGTFTDARAFSAGSAYLGERGRLGFAYARFENEYGIPEPGEPVSIDMRTNRYRIEGDLEEPLAGLRALRLRGVYSDYRHDELADGAIGQTFHNNEFEGRLELLHEPLLGYLGAVGLHGRYRDFEGRGEAAAFLAPSETRSIAAYLFEETHLTEGVGLELGVRVEGTEVEGTPRSGPRRERRFVPVSGSLGLVFDLAEGWSLGLTGSASQRAPSEVELFARGPHEATGTFEVGNPDFDEETSFSGELRIGGELGPISLDAAGFVTHYQDFIFGELSGVVVNEDGDPPLIGDPTFDELFYRARDARFHGGEVALEAELFELCGGMLGTDWQFDIVRARFTDGIDGDLPRITPIRWGGGIFFRHDRVDARFGFLRTEDQRNPAASETRTGSFTLLDLALSYRLALLEDRVPLELGLVARNLLNEEARNHVAFNTDEVLLPGRSFRFAIHASF